MPAPSGSHETSRHFAAGEKPNDTRRGWRDAAATAAARGWSMPKTSAREVRAMQSRNTRSNAATDGNRSTWSRSRFVRTVTAGEYRASVPSDSSASATRSLPSPPATSPPSAADAPPMHQSVSAGRSARRIVARKVEVVVLPCEPQTA